MIPDPGGADGGSPPRAPRILNPGRRGVAADLYLFPIRMPLEASLRGDRAYRLLRYEFDRLERKLGILSRAGYGEARLGDLQAAILRAGNACAEYMIRHLPEEEPTPAVVLERTLDADGSIVAESETEVQ